MLGIAIVAAGGLLHVVAEIIEAKLVVGAVGDVAGVGFLPLVGVHADQIASTVKPEPVVDRGHPFHVAASQVIVHRNDVHPFAFDRIEVGRERGDEGLAFAGHHFGDVSSVEDHAADQLHIVVPHPQKAATRLTANGKRLDQQVFERFPGENALAKLVRLPRNSSSVRA